MNTWKNEQPNEPGFFDILRGACVLAFSWKSPLAPAILPSVLEGYTLVRSLDKSDHSDSMAIGIYQKGERKYLVKYWQGKYKSLNYYLLVHEYLVTKIVRRYFVNHQGLKVSVPEAVECFSSSQQFVAVFEFIEGVTIDTLSSSDQIRLWTKSQAALESVGEGLTPDDRVSIGKRGPAAYLIFSILFSGLLLVRRPQEFVLVGRTLVRLMMLATKTFSQDLVLAHRDLTPNNLLLGSTGQLYILDFESLKYTLPGYDEAYLAVDPESKDVAALLQAKGTNSFLEFYILLHHVLGSGDFLAVNESYLSLLRNRVLSKSI